jgi:hypothetical protein
MENSDEEKLLDNLSKKTDNVDKSKESKHVDST